MNGFFLPTNGFRLPEIRFVRAVFYSLRRALIAAKFSIAGG